MLPYTIVFYVTIIDELISRDKFSAELNNNYINQNLINSKLVINSVKNLYI